MIKAIFQKHYLLFMFLLCLPVLMARVSQNPRGVIWSDAEGYYKYLPAVFVLKDVRQMPAGSVTPLLNDRGEYLNKYTVGVSYFQAPLFLLTLAILHPERRGAGEIFGDWFAYAVALSGFFVVFIGLWFLQRALQRHFSPQAVAWTLFSVFLGTNLFHYATKEMGMSHAYSFALAAFLVWHVPRFYANPGAKNAVILGVALGWITLIRPTNIVLILYVLLYDVYSWKAALERVKYWATRYRTVGWVAAASVLMWLPQMWYWHEMTGYWFRYSYTNEGFIYWAAPKVAAVLFDPQNGLVLYSPITVLMFGSVAHNLSVRKHSAPAVLLILLVSTYLFASWWAWWFGGAFGARAYVELFALLALPLAVFYEKTLSIRNRWAKGGLLACCVFLMYYSVKLSLLYNTLPGPWDGADWRWNWDKMLWLWGYLF